MFSGAMRAMRSRLVFWAMVVTLLMFGFPQDRQCNITLPPASHRNDDHEWRQGSAARARDSRSRALRREPALRGPAAGGDRAHQAFGARQHRLLSFRRGPALDTQGGGARR